MPINKCLALPHGAVNSGSPPAAPRALKPTPTVHAMSPRRASRSSLCRIALAALAALAAVGCDTVGPVAPCDLEADPARPQGLAALTMDGPAGAPLAAAALVDSLRKYGGVAIVGFKAATSPRADHGARGEPSQAGSGPGRRATTKAAVSDRAIREGLAHLEQRGARVRAYLDRLGQAVVVMPPELGPELRNHPLVDYVAPRGVMRTDGLAWDRVGDRYWALDTIRAPEAWALASGAGVRVLVIDGGYHRGHPDLPVAPLENCAGIGGGGCATTDGHGTMVTGVIAMRDAGTGPAGAAPGLRDVDLYQFGACHAGACYYDDIARGIDQAILWGVDVINLSLSGGDSPAVREAVARAEAAGIVVVASAGNDLSDHVVYPAGYSSVIGVAGIVASGRHATTQADTRHSCMSWSNYGNHVFLSAPFYAYTTAGADGLREHACGTSFSAPYVTATVALMRAAAPALAPATIRALLARTAIDHGEPGWDPYYGHGVLDTGAAVRLADRAAAAGRMAAARPCGPDPARNPPDNA